MRTTSMGRKVVGRVVSAAFALGLLLAGTASCQQTTGHGQDWTRFGFDAARTNEGPKETGITASDLSALKRQRVQLGGTVDASPIYLHGVQIDGASHDAFFVTTTYGETLAIDADRGTVLWRFTPPGYASWAGSYRITTATPVADPNRSSIYAAAPDGVVRKLAVADGSVQWSTAVTKLPAREKIASALNLAGGRVIVVTGGYIGDAAPYQGHVAVLDSRDGHVENVWNALCSDRAGLLDPASCASSGAAIWGRAAAVVDPSSGDLFVATGNASWDGQTSWGDAALELSPDAAKLLGNYTPSNTAQLDASDLDLGSTAPVLLGDGLVAQGGKDGKIRLLRWSAMLGQSGHQGGELQTVSTPSGTDLFTAPAVWHAGGETWLIAADNGGTEAWNLTQGRLQTAWKNTHGGTSPVVAGGLLYVYDPAGGLRVYEPDTGRLLADLASGPGHWNSPIVTDGRIALPEGNANRHSTSGVLDIWRVGP